MASIPSLVHAALMAAVGAAFLAGGAWLLALGGSPYYAVCGLVLLADAAAIVARRAWALDLYLALLAATCLWALAESGLDGWALLPRLDLLVVLGLPWLLPPVRCQLAGHSRLTHGRTALTAAWLAVPLVLIGVAALLGGAGNRPAAAGTGVGSQVTAAASGADWQDYGATSGGSKYSALAQLTPANVASLKPAWTFRFGEAVANGLEVTPIKIGDTLYACNSADIVVALDPDSGRVRWRYDPKLDKTNVPFPVCRGVSYYRVPGAAGACAERIFTNTYDARLIAIDARTGMACRDFGTNGQVSLLAGLGEVRKGYYASSSAPTIVRGRIVVGAMVPDGQYWGEPSGVIRAFDAVTGALSWAYDVGRPDRTGMPPPGSAYTRATPNSWAPMSADEKLGLVFVPTGAATPDHYAPWRRPFDEEIGSAVMALDAGTGRRRWVFRTVNHDLWDYDVGSQPVLVDIQGPRGPVKALLQATKRGETFLLDRATGHPLDTVTERPAPQAGSAPGEHVARTQPFPSAVPALDGGLLTERAMWGLTPLDQLWCRVRLREARYEGPMTPPGLSPSILYPGNLGGMDWGGVSVDGRRGVMIAISNHVGNYVRLVPRKVVDATGLRLFGEPMKIDNLQSVLNLAIQANLAFGASKEPFLSPLGVPCQQPPWSRLTAVDLKTGRVLWSKPLGSGKDNGPFGIPSRLPLPMGVPAMGGALVTRSGLTFVGASTDRSFRAFDTGTGEMLWQAPLPESGNATPMTYLSPKGRQFVLVAAGGHKLLHGRNGDAIVAFAVPEPHR